MSLGAAWNFFKEFLKNSNPIDGTGVAGSVLSVAPGDDGEVEKACERPDLARRRHGTGFTRTNLITC
jgi:hypothetical protein